jgi:cell division protein FtsL
MTPSAATAAGRAPGLRRSPAPRVPRRVSGPGPSARPVRPRPQARTATRPAPAGVLLGAAGRRLRALPDARLLDRLVRGRAWIGLVAVALMGIVFMQVSMLQLNAGIGRAVTSADTLDRENSTLRAQISQLDSGEQIQKVATQLGMVMPAAGDVRFLDARQADGARAAANITAPAPAAATRAAAVQAPAVQSAAAAVQPQSVQPAQSAQAAAPPATATTAAAAAPAATTTQASPPPSPTPAHPPPPTPSAAPGPPATTSAGGVSAPAVQR